MQCQGHGSQSWPQPVRNPVGLLPGVIERASDTPAPPVSCAPKAGRLGGHRHRSSVPAQRPCPSQEMLTASLSARSSEDV